MDYPASLAYLDKHHDLVTAGMAILAVFVSSLSVILAVCNMVIQRSHNRKSVLPIGHISVGDYENDIFVRLRNDGIGPMIIERLSVSQPTSSDTKDALIHCMPDGILWSTFVEDVSGRAISAKEYITLVQLEGETKDPRFAKTKQNVRKTLSGLTVKVEYKNIYGERMSPAIRNLSWFGR